MSKHVNYIPFGKPNFSEAEIAAVAQVMRKGWVGMGPEVIEFENELARYLEVKHVVTVNSCTSGLHLALLAQGIKEGDEVICPSLTWCSSANAALYVGAKPVFCDIDSDTLCLTPQTVLAKVTEKTKAVMLVHYGGFAVDVAELRRALPAHIKIIEDAAHAFGSSYENGKRVGSSGNLVCFSFYANKNLSTGEGGAVALNDQEAADQMRSLRQHALPLNAWMRFTHPKSVMLSNQLTELGYKMNFTDLQASIGRVQLARYAELQTQRLKVAEIYVDRLAKHFPQMRFQKDVLSPRHSRHLFVVRLPENSSKTREELILELRARNVGATIHYSPLHTMPLYRVEKSQPAPSLPVTEREARTVLTLPISASMSEAEAHYVVDSLEEILA